MENQFIMKESDQFCVAFNDIISFLKELETKQSSTGLTVNKSSLCTSPI